MRRLELTAALLLTWLVNPCMAGDRHIPLHEKSGATLYVAGQIEGYGHTEFLLDTGASYMAINEGLLKELERSGHAHYLRRLAASLADGRRRSVVPGRRRSSLDPGWTRT